MSTKELIPTLGRQILRNLGDRSYEKRKQAALEIEQVIKDFNPSLPSTGERIQSIIYTLVREYAYSTLPNSRKGGLIGLSAVAVALLDDASIYLELLLPPVLKSFSDPEPRVRYYACEALYNIAKVVRGYSLVFFNEIFDGLCKLYADVDVDVKSGAQLLDRLIKDIVAESKAFDVERFIPLLRERLRIRNPFTRQLIVGWILHLNSMPDIDMLEYLPEYLGGILDMLSDLNKDIRQQAYSALASLLKQIMLTPEVDLGSMLGLLLQRCDSSDSFTRVIVLSWINEFLSLGKYTLLPFTADILSAVISCIPDHEREIRQQAQKCNETLLRLLGECSLIREMPPQIEQAAIGEENKLDTNIESKDGSNIDVKNNDDDEDEDDYDNIQELYLVSPSFDNDKALIKLSLLLNSILEQLSNRYIQSRFTSLRWISLLLSMSARTGENKADKDIEKPQMIVLKSSQNKTFHFAYLSKFPLNCVTTFFPSLLNTLLDPDENVVRLDLQVIARLCILETYSRSNNEIIKNTKIHQVNFDIVMVNLIRLFSEDLEFLENRGALIIRQFCLLLNPEVVFKGVATLLAEIEEEDFTASLVQTLHLILMTAPEISPLRRLLKNSQLTSEGRALFDCLYKSWCCSSVSALGLCMLAQSYDLLYCLTKELSNFEVTVGFLIQLDRLVQLIESPILFHVRLHLLQPQLYYPLHLALFNILMLLPQGNVYTSLSARLSAATSLTTTRTFKCMFIDANKDGEKTIGDVDEIEHTKDSDMPAPGRLQSSLEDYITHFKRIQKIQVASREMIANSASLLSIKQES